MSNGITRQNACDRIHWRMNNFKQLLQGGDFPGSDTFTETANYCANDGDNQDETMLVFIEADTVCRLNSVHGYEFAAFSPVPGATQVNGKWVQPGAC